MAGMAAGAGMGGAKVIIKIFDVKSISCKPEIKYKNRNIRFYGKLNI